MFKIWSDGDREEEGVCPLAKDRRPTPALPQRVRHTPSHVRQNFLISASSQASKGSKGSSGLRRSSTAGSLQSMDTTTCQMSKDSSGLRHTSSGSLQSMEASGSRGLRRSSTSQSLQSMDTASCQASTGSRSRARKYADQQHEETLEGTRTSQSTRDVRFTVTKTRHMPQTRSVTQSRASVTATQT